MKIKKYKESYSKKVNKKPIKNKKRMDVLWILFISIIAFLISISFSFISEYIILNQEGFIALLFIIIFILLGIVFDMIGVSITVADINTFNSMAAKRVRGANIAVKLIRNNEKASSFCNDVIGDICGIVSGSAGVSLATNISESYNYDLFITTLIITALIASITIGGKALGKITAINKSTNILYRFSRIISLFYKF